MSLKLDHDHEIVHPAHIGGPLIFLIKQGCEQ